MSEKNHASSRTNGANPTKNEAHLSRNRLPESDEAARTQRDPRTEGLGASIREGFDMPGIAQVVARYPVTSLVAGFSVGFGLGVLATAIFPREEESWLERHDLTRSDLTRSMNEVSANLKRVPNMLTQIAHRLPDSFWNR